MGIPRWGIDSSTRMRKIIYSINVFTKKIVWFLDYFFFLSANMAWKYSNTTQINTDIALKKNGVICTILNFGFWSNTSMGHRFEHQDAKDNIFDQRFHKKNRMVSGL